MKINLQPMLVKRCHIRLFKYWIRISYVNCSNKATEGACVKWGTQNLFLCLYKKIIVTCKMAKNLYEGKNIYRLDGLKHLKQMSLDCYLVLTLQKIFWNYYIIVDTLFNLINCSRKCRYTNLELQEAILQPFPITFVSWVKLI